MGKFEATYGPSRDSAKPVDLAKARQLRDAGLTKALIAQRLGISVAWLNRMLAAPSSSQVAVA